MLLEEGFLRRRNNSNACKEILIVSLVETHKAQALWVEV